MARFFKRYGQVSPIVVCVHDDAYVIIDGLASFPNKQSVSSHAANATTLARSRKMKTPIEQSIEEYYERQSQGMEVSSLSVVYVPTHDRIPPCPDNVSPASWRTILISSTSISLLIVLTYGVVTTVFAKGKAQLSTRLEPRLYQPPARRVVSGVAVIPPTAPGGREMRSKTATLGCPHRATFVTQDEPSTNRPELVDLRCGGATEATNRRC